MGTAMERFFAGHYRAPEPAHAAAALAEFFAMPDAAANPAWRMFVVAARHDPAVADAFTALAAARPDLAAIIHSILAAANNAGLPDPLSMPIAEPGDLDVVWSAFLVSGADAPVQRILDVLLWEDRTLAALDRWVRAPGLLSYFSRPAAVKRLHAAGLATDATQPRLGNGEDVDLHVWKLMSNGWQARTELPFPLPDDHVLHLAIKGAACWSLQSNAAQHPAVARLYATLPHPERLPRFVP